MDKLHKEKVAKFKKEHGHPIPEDGRKVIVAKRQEGKTQTLIDIAYKKIGEGKDVLFVTPHSGIQNFTISMFRSTVNTYNVIYNNVRRILIFENGSKVTFKTMEQISGRGVCHSLIRDSFSIFDNAALDVYDFDLITVNGELYEEG